MKRKWEDNITIHLTDVGCSVEGTDPELCPVLGFGLNCDEPLEPVTGEFWVN